MQAGAEAAAILERREKARRVQELQEKAEEERRVRQAELRTQADAEAAAILRARRMQETAAAAGAESAASGLATQAAAAMEAVRDRTPTRGQPGWAQQPDSAQVLAALQQLQSSSWDDAAALRDTLLELQGFVGQHPELLPLCNTARQRIRALKAARANAPPITSSEPAAEDEATPDDFVCPITQDLMADPVVTADGHTYEREAILRWLHKQQSCGLPCTSPLTGEPLEHINLVPNVALRGLIRELLGSSASHGYVHGN
jgi:hypothetical protein